MNFLFALLISTLLLGSYTHAEPSDLLAADSAIAGIGIRDCKNTDDVLCCNHTDVDLTGRVPIPYGNAFSIRLMLLMRDTMAPAMKTTRLLMRQFLDCMLPAAILTNICRALLLATPLARRRIRQGFRLFLRRRRPVLF
jgi:hypothetical protein